MKRSLYSVKNEMILPLLLTFLVVSSSHQFEEEEDYSLMDSASLDIEDKKINPKFAVLSSHDDITEKLLQPKEFVEVKSKHEIREAFTRKKLNSLTGLREKQLFGEKIRFYSERSDATTTHEALETTTMTTKNVDLQYKKKAQVKTLHYYTKMAKLTPSQTIKARVTGQKKVNTKYTEYDVKGTTREMTVLNIGDFQRERTIQKKLIAVSKHNLETKGSSTDKGVLLETPHIEHYKQTTDKMAKHQQLKEVIRQLEKKLQSLDIVRNAPDGKKDTTATTTATSRHQKQTTLTEIDGYDDDPHVDVFYDSDNTLAGHNLDGKKILRHIIKHQYNEPLLLLYNYMRRMDMKVSLFLAKLKEVDNKYYALAGENRL